MKIDFTFINKINTFKKIHYKCLSLNIKNILFSGVSNDEEKFSKSFDSMNRD